VAGLYCYAMSDNPTAAVLVIGDEILSGRTQDSNSNAIARFLAPLGIWLKEIRVVGDDEAAIVAALNELRARHTYLFTTGGIGPTHDDITADAVAKAFGVGIDFHPEAMARLAARFAPGEFNAMRQRMARIPLGAELIANKLSAAPGFHIGNVFVMAGIPAVMQAMLEDVAPRLTLGRVVLAVTIAASVAEGSVAGPLAAVQREHPHVAIGSYPVYHSEGPSVQLVVRGTDLELIEHAAQALERMLRDAGATPQRLHHDR
jgi:molybdenum cofactor synthesis domain-containing protein